MKNTLTTKTRRFKKKKMRNLNKIERHGIVSNSEYKKRQLNKKERSYMIFLSMCIVAITLAMLYLLGFV